MTLNGPNDLIRAVFVIDELECVVALEIQLLRDGM
jgi:hypothetical protein